tara:strand:+ start:24924 stop:26072 length:1149 start_codon:yes stop_codon:yes gene_type:complete
MGIVKNNGRRMKIGILTSSRADFGIYSSLIKAMSCDNYFDLQLIAFGTHLSKEHGFTVTEIEESFSGKIHRVKHTMRDGNSCDISLSAGETHLAFTQFWNENNFDLVLCLGDRYEMNAAVQASIPFGIKLAHFHGGEKTLGAFDNIYRHQITLASQYHFTATDAFADRVKELLDKNINLVFSVGSLSLSEMKDIETIDEETFREKYQLPNKPFILSTFHPETIGNQNVVYSEEMIAALKNITDTHHLVLSMPNADTNGVIFRNQLKKYQASFPNKITLVESFGKTNYFSALKHCEFVLGNSSSGIIEAASFGKYVINVGERQKGRLQSGNCINVEFNSQDISSALRKLIDNPATFSGENKYVKTDTVQKVLSTIRSIGNGEF